MADDSEFYGLDPEKKTKPFVGPQQEMPGPFQGQGYAPRDPLEAAIMALLWAEMQNQAKHKYTLPGGHDETAIAGRTYPMNALYRQPTIGEQIMDWKGSQLDFQHSRADAQREMVREQQKREGGLYGK